MGGDFYMHPPANTVESIFRNLFFRAYMDLDGIGRIGFAFDGCGDRQGDLLEQMGLEFDRADGAVDGDILDFFHSSDLVDGLGLDFSLRFGLGRTGNRDDDGNLEDTAAANSLAIGAGLNLVVV